MKKALKITRNILLGVLAAAVLFLLGLFIYNRIKVSNEKELLENPPIGQFVTVDDHNMSVYVSGEGKHTLVFLAGAGDPYPILSFKPFADRFKDMRVVVVEKFGYGFSDGIDGARDVDTRVRQNRETLKAAGVEGPYILCPHSYSGLESIYWAQLYPDEVEAIIGLDMAVPKSYDSYDEKTIDCVGSSYTLKRIIREMGILRLLAGSSLSDGYTEEEKDAGVALSCSRYCNETFENESKCIIEDREKIESKAVPDVPTLLIVSDGKVTEGWIDFEKDYASSLSNSDILFLECGHTVYEYEPESCEKAIRDFMSTLY